MKWTICLLVACCTHLNAQTPTPTPTATPWKPMLGKSSPSPTSTPEPPKSRHIFVKIGDDKGKPVPYVQAIAILKCGDLQKMEESADGVFYAECNDQCVKIYTAAVGFEASIKKFPMESGTTSIAMKPSEQRSSVIVNPMADIQGADGRIFTTMGTDGRIGVVGTDIVFLKGGRASAPSRVITGVAPGSMIEAKTSRGKHFRIWIVDASQKISLIEYTRPDK